MLQIISVGFGICWREEKCCVQIDGRKYDCCGWMCVEGRWWNTCYISACAKCKLPMIKESGPLPSVFHFTILELFHVHTENARNGLQVCRLSVGFLSGEQQYFKKNWKFLNIFGWKKIKSLLWSWWPWWCALKWMCWVKRSCWSYNKNNPCLVTWGDTCMLT